MRPFICGQAQDPPPHVTVSVAPLPMVVAPLPPSTAQPDHAIACVTVMFSLPCSVPPLRVRFWTVTLPVMVTVPPLMVAVSFAPGTVPHNQCAASLQFPDELSQTQVVAGAWGEAANTPALKSSASAAIKPRVKIRERMVTSSCYWFSPR